MAGLRLLILLLALPLLTIGATAQDLRAWDRNNDGVITRSEWRGTLQDFRDRDGNRDGVLSGNELRQPDWAWSNPDENDQSFASFDRNGNGLISRGEWRGTRVAFTRADRNGDNQISRSEFSNLDAGNVEDDLTNFDALDNDGSGRIERDEWSGTRVAFNRLDLNRDGVLSRREMASIDVAVADRRGFEETVIVDAQQAWTDTGAYVNAGDFVTFRADGTIQMTTGTDDRATPSGSLSGRTASNSPRPDQKAGTLLLRIGNAVEAFGANGSFTARRSGRVYLGVNDDHVLDNSGEYRVLLSISPR